MTTTANKKNRMPELKKLAAANHCTVDDDKSDSTLWINVEKGWSWENGERSCMVHRYGLHGSYEPKWRQDAIADAIDRLKCEPTEQIPYLYDDE